MTFTSRFVALVLAPALILALSSCQLPAFSQGAADSAERKQYRTELKSEVATFANLGPLLDLCRNASRMEVFEGLPHPYFETQLMQKELLRADVTMNHGFGFYTPALKLNSGDVQTLRTEVCQKSAYKKFAGMKSCGGFHPDLLLRYHTTQGIVDTHLCFGCNEAIFFGPQTRAHVDIEQAPSDRWMTIQQNYQTKRPKRAQR
jgi:hypothetical protein